MQTRAQDGAGAAANPFISSRHSGGTGDPNAWADPERQDRLDRYERPYI